MGNGGGFVFDCRCIDNPGLLPGNMAFTGQDQRIIDLLESDEAAQRFYLLIQGTVDVAIENYTHNGYEALQVAFGCTGGQHRSVYCAEKLTRYLAEKGIEVELHHSERHLWP
jgi:RNase adaptor protein for sRNA GlmZ degradation